MPLLPGKIVPDLPLASTRGDNIKLSDYRGHYLILYFYPKDNTPGCTQEGLDFRDHTPQFTELNTVILGVSRDSLRVHDGFKCKHDFPFDLVSDTDEQLCQQFDVIKMKNMYGKQVRGIERSTFLIDPEGKLIYEWRKVSVKNHIAEVLKTVKELSAQ